MGAAAASGGFSPYGVRLCREVEHAWTSYNIYIHASI